MNDDPIEGVVSHVETSERHLKVWCRVPDSREQTLINDVITSQSESSFISGKYAVHPSLIKKDVVYCCNVQDNWCRCKVLEFVNDNTSASVQLLDVGNTGTVKLDQFHRCYFPALNVRPEAHDYILYGILADNVNWDCQSVKFCRSRLLDQVLQKKMAKKENDMSTDFSYYSLPLAIGECYKSFVMMAASTKRFYIQTQENRDHYGWTNMMEELSSYGCNQKEPAKYLKPGTPCLVYNGDKLRFSRGLIKKMNDRAFVVYYVDFGNFEIKDRKEIFALPERFTNTPSLAYECILEDDFFPIDLQSLDENSEIEILVMTDCPPHKVKFRRSKTSSQYKKLSLESDSHWEVLVVHVKNPFLFYIRLSMYEKKYNLLDTQLQVACMGEFKEEMEELVQGPCCVYSLEDKKWFRGDIISSRGNMCQVYYVDTGVHEVVPRGSFLREIPREFVNMLPALAIPCSLVYLPKDIKKFQSVEAKRLFLNLIFNKPLLNINVFETKDDVAEVQLTCNDDKLCINNEIIERLTTGGLRATIPKLQLRKTEDIFVTYYESMRLFFGQLNRINISALDNLQRDLQQYGHSLMMSEGEFVLGKSGDIGDFCLALFSADRQFYRGKVISSADDSMEIFFVDYGNTETVSSTLVKELPSFLAAQPPMGFMCTSIDCRAFESDPNDIKKALLNQSVEVEIIKEVDGVFEVHFIESEKNDPIRSFLAQDRDLVVKSPRPRPIFQSFKPLAHEIVEIVLFIHLRNWKRFYVQLTKYEDDAVQLMHDIEQEMLRNPPVVTMDSIAIGMPCLALFFTNMAWYRAIVLKILPNDYVKVEYVDFGNRENIPLGNVRQIPSRLMDKPRLSIECMFNDYSEFQMPDDLLLEFDQEAIDKTFILKFDGGVESVEPKKVTFVDKCGKTLLDKFKNKAMNQSKRNFPDHPQGYQNFSENRSNVFVDDHVNMDKPWEGGNRTAAHGSHFDNRRGGDTAKYFETNSNSWNQRRGEMSEEEPRWDNRYEVNRQNNSSRSPSESSESRQKPWSNNRQTYTNGNNGNSNWPLTNSNEDLGSSSFNRQDYARNNKGESNFKRDSRDIPPRFRNKFDSSRNNRQHQVDGDGDRKYESRQFYSRDESWTKGRQDRNGDNWKKNNRDENGESSSFDRKPWKNNRDQETRSTRSRNSTESYGETSKFIQKSELKECPVEVGSYKEVTVLYVVNPDDFYCSLVDFDANLKFLDMTNKLNAKCNGDLGQNLTSPKAGIICSALYSADETWYRAKIVRVTGDEVEVYFIDYGNSDVCQLNSLKILEEEFRILPGRAVKCSLFNVKSHTGKEWSDEEADTFANAVLSLNFLVYFKSKTDSGVFVIDMIDSAIFSESSIRYKLISENSFKPAETTDSLYLELSNMSVHLSTYKKVNFSIGQKLQVFVTWINSPGEFYGQMTSESDNFAIYEAKLSNFYKTNSNDELVLNQPARGMPCIAPFDYAGQKDWFRAFILAADGDELIVHYVDYGNIGLVSVNEVKRIVPEFEELPAQAIRFVLNGVRPCGSYWKNISSAELERYYSGDLECSVVKEIDGKFFVDVTVEGKSVSNELINGGYAASGDNFIPESSVIKELASKIVLTSQVYSSDSKELVITTAKENGVACDQGDSFNDSFTSELCDACVPVSLEAKEIVTDDLFLGNVSFVNSVTDFYIQRCSDLEEINNLSAVLNDTYGDSEPEESLSLKVGDMCLARFSEDGNWYRAKVLGERDFGLTLLYVDFGNTDWVTLDEIRLMPTSADWLTLPPYAISCSLFDVKADEGAENVTLTFNSFLERNNHDVEVVVKDRVEQKYIVQLNSLGEDVASAVFKEGDIASAEKCVNEVEVSGELQSTLLKVNESTLSGVLNVVVSYVTSPTDFWIQTVNDQLKLVELLSDLDLYSRSADLVNPENLEIGSVVLALYHADECWYRAEVIQKISDTTVNVFFVDYGNSDNVDIQDLRILSEEFERIPVMSFHCSLYTIEEPKDGWSVEVMDFFKSFANEEKNLQAEIMKTVNGVYLINLSEDGKQLAGNIFNNAPVINSLPKVKRLECEIGEQIETVLTHIMSPSEFWVQKLADADQVGAISKELELSCFVVSDVSESERQLVIGDVYGVQFSLDNCWYRGQLLRETADGFEVLFIDFGNTEMVTRERVAFIETTNLANLPAFAIKCTLKSNVHSWPNDVIEMFKTEYCEKTCLIEFLEPSEDSYVVSLFDMEVDVAKKLLGEVNTYDNENSNDSQESVASACAEASDCREAVEIVMLDSEESSTGSQDSTDLYPAESSNKLALEDNNVVNVDVKLETYEVGQNFNSSDSNEVVIADESEIEVLSEKFATHLKVPSYVEFAEVAASHARSLSPTPSCIGNTSGYETVCSSDNMNRDDEEHHSIEKKLDSGGVFYKHSIGYALGAVYNTGKLEDIVEESIDVHVSESELSDAQFCATNVSLPDDSLSSEGESDGSSTVKDNSGELDRDVVASNSTEQKDFIEEIVCVQVVGKNIASNESDTDSVD
ncbi:hypothetical protein CHUAL_013370 [Chamberlinius hualienensis]